MRLVIDTSVVVSSMRSSSGASRELVASALAGSFDLLISVPLVLEYEAVMTRPEQILSSGASLDAVERLLYGLVRVGTEIELDEYVGPESPDRGDNHILSLAATGKADAIVSYNTRHFMSASRALGINLWTPGAALRLLRSR